MDNAQDAFADVHDPIPEEEHLKAASPNALATEATSSANSQINCASPNACGAPPMPVLGSGQALGLDDSVDMHRGSTCGINPATEGDPVGSALAGETQDGHDNDDQVKITAPPKLTSDRKAREIPGNKMLTPAPENHGANRRQMDTPERGREARTRGTRRAHRRHGQPGARVPAGAIESHQKAGPTRLSATSWNIPSWTIQTYVYWNLNAAEVEQRSTEPLETETGGTAGAMNKADRQPAAGLHNIHHLGSTRVGFKPHHKEKRRCRLTSRTR